MIAGGTVAAGFALVAVAAPVITAAVGQDPFTYHLDTLDGAGSPVGPGGGISAHHWFGVEPLTGRDLFAVVVHGTRTSLGLGLAATALSVGIGVAVGVTAGFFGGWYDQVISRAVDTLLGFPSLVFMIALGVIAPPEFPRPLLVVLVIGAFGWPSTARVVRGQTLSLRQRSFVVASTAMGAGPWHVLRRQVLPNLGVTVIVLVTVLIPQMIGLEAALSFLGVGVPPPTPSWGRSIGEAIAWVRTDPAYLAFPGGALLLVTLALNLFGDGLRDLLDPRLTGLRRTAPGTSALTSTPPAAPAPAPAPGGDA